MGFLRVMAGPVFGVTLLVIVYLLNVWLDFAPRRDSYDGGNGGARFDDPYYYDVEDYGETAGEPMEMPAEAELGDIRSMLELLDSDIEENDSGQIVALYVYGQAADRHLQRIGQLSELETLYLANGLSVTDDGVRHLQYSYRMRSLTLRDSQLTDSGLRVLEDLSRLEQLNIEGTRVTLDGVQRFQQIQPGCYVMY